MSIVAFHNVEKSFGGQRLFTTVTFAVDAHDHAVLVGRNGTGKTTLLRLIAGDEHPDSGTVARARGRRVWLHDQTPELQPDRPVRDYLLEAFGEAVQLEAALRDTEERLSGLAEHSPELRDTMKNYQQLQRRFEAAGGYDYRSRLSGVVEGLGLPEEMLERRILSLSGGELTRVTLARALLADADLLLLDEPTNHLDIDSVEWLEGFLQDYPRAFLLVTHDRRLLERVGRRVLAVEHEHVEVQTGDFATYVREHESRQRLVPQQFEQDKEKIEQLQRFYDRFHAKKNKAKQAKAKLTQIERIKSGMKAPPREVKQLQAGPAAAPALGARGAGDEDAGRHRGRRRPTRAARAACCATWTSSWSAARRSPCWAPTARARPRWWRPSPALRSLAAGAAHWGHNVRVAYYSQQGRELNEADTVLQIGAAAGGPRRGAGAAPAGPLPVRLRRGGQAGGHAVGRRAQPAAPAGPAGGRRQLPAAGRAHQPPGHGLGRGPGGRPGRLHRHHPAGDPRPPPHRHGGRPGAGDPRRHAAQPPLGAALLGGARGAPGRRRRRRAGHAAPRPAAPPAAGAPRAAPAGAAKARQSTQSAEEARRARARLRAAEAAVLRAEKRLGQIDAELAEPDTYADRDVLARLLDERSVVETRLEREYEEWERLVDETG